MTDSSFGYDFTLSSGPRTKPMLNEVANRIRNPTGREEDWGTWERACQHAAMRGFHEPPSLIHPSSLEDAYLTMYSLKPLISQQTRTPSFTREYIVYLYRVAAVKDASKRGR